MMFFWLKKKDAVTHRDDEGYNQNISDNIIMSVDFIVKEKSGLNDENNSCETQEIRVYKSSTMFHQILQNIIMIHKN